MSEAPATGLRPAPGDGGAAAGFRLRAARDEDGDALGQFLTGLSPRSRYLRFFTGAPCLTHAALRRMTGGGPAGDCTDALLAVDGRAIIGHGMAVDARNPSGATVADIGVVVADERQRQGVGSALILALAARALARGVTVLAMDVLAENRSVLGLITSRLPEARPAAAGSLVTIRVPLPQSAPDGAKTWA